MIPKLTAQEVLNKAFEIAKKNGWNVVETGFKAIEFEGTAIPLTGLLFDHAFCKALWGKGKGYELAGTTLDGKEWQNHLQDMVICTDPIEYLADHLSHI